MSKGRVHFIAIGGSIMHSLAICLQKMGYVVSGSDDEIFEPAKSTLNENNLLPSSFGWDESHLTTLSHSIFLVMQTYF